MWWKLAQMREPTVFGEPLHRFHSTPACPKFVQAV